MMPMGRHMGKSGLYHTEGMLLHNGLLVRVVKRRTLKTENLGEKRKLLFQISCIKLGHSL